MLRNPAFPSSAQWRCAVRNRGPLAVLAAFLLLAFASPADADDGVFAGSSPAPELTSGPASPDNDLAPRWTFSTPEVATFECSLSRDDVLVGDWAQCSSPVAYDLSSEPDGDYTFAVRARGADGTLSEPATGGYRLDTSVPALPTIVALPGPAAADRTPDWSFAGGAGGAGETFECRVDRDGSAGAAWAPCASPHQADLTGDPDGSYVFSVRGVAENGTRGPVRTDGYLLDTRAPDAPELSSSLPPVGNAQSATLAFGAEPAAQVECRIDGTAVTDWSPCESPYTFDFAGRPDGAYRLELRATDSAGNTSAPAAAEYTLDTTAPVAPAVDQPAPAPDSMLQPEFDFADDASDTYECRLDGPGGYATGWQACSSPAPYDLTGQPDGTYSFSVRGTDAAGNTGESGGASYVLARDPEAVDLRSGPGRTGRTRQPRWSFAVAGGSGFVCSLGFESAVLFKPATCGSPRTYDLSYRADGTYVFTVRASGSARADREPAIQEYELDSTAPARPDLEAEPVSPAADRKPGWRFSGEDGAALDCRVARGSATVVDWTSCTNHRRFDLGGAPDGDYRVSVRARDAAGNVSSPTTSDYDLDSTAPAAPTLKAAPVADAIDRSPTWAFSGESDAVFTCTLTRGSDVVAAKGSCAGARTYNLSGAQPGTYTFSVEATDTAGNKSQARVASYKLAAAPAKAPAGGGGAGSGGAGAGSSGGGDAGLSANGGGAGSDPGAAAGGAGAGDGAQPGATGGGRTSTTGPGRTGAQRTPAARAGGTADTPAGDAAAAAAGAGAGARGGNAAGRATDSAQTSTGDGGSKRSLNPSGIADALKNALGGATRETREAITSDAGKVVFPMSLLILLGAFLLVQSRIDRGDPKLALAPIDGAPDLEFGPPPTRR